MQHMDFIVFTAINYLAGHNKLLDMTMIGLAKWGVLFYGVLLAYMFFTNRAAAPKNRETAVRAVIAGFLALGVNLLVGLFFFRPRPFASHKVNLLIDHPADSSFPSDHSAGAAGMSFAMLSRNLTIGKVMTVFTLLMIFARVYVGVHYPLDVLAGLVTGYVGTMTEKAIWPVIRPFVDQLMEHWDTMFARVSSHLSH